MKGPSGEGRWSSGGKLFLLTALLTPPTILVHEFGHLAIPLVKGIPAELHPTFVSGGAGDADPWTQAAQSGGGPLLTVLMTAMGILLFRRTSSLWGFALAVAAVSRMATSPAYLGLRLFLLGLGRPFTGNPNFDEFTFARILGVSGIVAAVAVSAFLAGVLWLLLRQVPRGRRGIYLGAASAGVIVAGLAMHALPPVVLLSS